MQIRLPKRSWWNKFKDSWTHTFKNWNDNKYVSFYMYDEEETVASAAAYAKILNKTLLKTLKLLMMLSNKNFLINKPFLQQMKRVMLKKLSLF